MIGLSALIGNILVGLCFIPIILYYWKSDPKTRKTNDYNFSIIDYISKAFMPLLLFPILEGTKILFELSPRIQTLTTTIALGICLGYIMSSSVSYFFFLRQRQSRIIEQTLFESLVSHHPYQESCINSQTLDPCESWDEHYEKMRSIARTKREEWMKVRGIKTSRKLLFIKLGVSPQEIHSPAYDSLTENDLEVYNGFQDYSLGKDIP